MASVIEHAASNVFEEAVDELYGQSKKSWALILLAFILGGVAAAVVAVWFRRRGAAEAVGGPDADTTATQFGSQASEARVRQFAQGLGVVAPARTDRQH